VEGGLLGDLVPFIFILVIPDGNYQFCLSSVFSRELDSCLSRTFVTFFVRFLLLALECDESGRSGFFLYRIFC
jgi:hypothetical protein